MSEPNKREFVSINIRAMAVQRHLIDQAAERLGRSRSDFVLEAATRHAEDVLLDQALFARDADAFAQFQVMLDPPPRSNERLRRFLNEKSPWDGT